MDRGIEMFIGSRKAKDIGICMLVTAVYLVIGCRLINASIWVDEAFTLELIQHDYLDIIRLTATDVHPPLYYLICKFSVSLFTWICPNLNVVVIAKWVSYMPFVIGVMVCTYVVRKELGRLYCGAYLLFILIMPEMLHYSYEIRMYSYGMIFVLCAYISSKPLIVDKSVFNKSWSIFIIWSLLAAYTHYYACVAVAFLYLILLVSSFRSRERKNLRTCIKYTGITIVCYLPWLNIVIKTLKRVSESFHISELTWRTVLGYFMYIVRPVVSNRQLGYGVVVIIYMFISVLCMRMIAKVRSGGDTIWKLAGIGISFWVIGVGVLVSLTVRPLFLPRYIVLTLPCFWLSVCLLLSDNDRLSGRDRKMGYIILCILVLLSIRNVKKLAIEEQSYRDDLDVLTSSVFDQTENVKVVTLFSNITDKINRDSHLNRTITTQFGIDAYLYESSESELTMSVYHNIHDNCDGEEVYDWIDDGHVVYLLADRHDVVECDLLKNKLFILEYLGTYGLEEYEFDIYNVHLNNAHLK